MKLTKEMIREIKDAIVKETYNAKVDDVKNKLGKLAENIIENLGITKLFNENGGKKLLGDFAYFTNEVAFRDEYFGSYRFNVEIKEHPRTIKYLYCFVEEETNNSCNTIKMTDEMKVIFKELKVLSDSRDKFSNELNKVLNSCTTDKQLIEILPEAAKYITYSSSKNLPICSVDSLNFVKNVLKK